MIASTGNIIRTLMDSAAHTLDDIELAWVRNGTSTLCETELDNLAAQLAALAMSFSTAKDSELPDNDDMAKILWGFANQAEAIGALVKAGVDAGNIIKARQDATGQ